MAGSLVPLWPLWLFASRSLLFWIPGLWYGFLPYFLLSESWTSTSHGHCNLWPQELNPCCQISYRISWCLAGYIHSSLSSFPSLTCLKRRPPVPHSLDHCPKCCAVVPDMFQVSPSTSLVPMQNCSVAKGWTSFIHLSTATWMKAPGQHQTSRDEGSGWQMRILVPCAGHLWFPGASSQLMLSQHRCSIAHVLFFILWPFWGFWIS